MSSSTLDEQMEAWERSLKDVGLGRAPLDAFLELSVRDMTHAAGHIDCPYCRRHMLLEADEIAQVMERVRSDGNRQHVHGLRGRTRTLLTSFQIVANVLLGGLRRAGVI